MNQPRADITQRRHRIPRIAAGIAVLSLAFGVLVPGTGRAAERPAMFQGSLFQSRPAPQTLFLDSSHRLASADRAAPPLLRRTENRKSSVEAFAARASVAGVLLLTADQIVRSMDSVIETMQLRREDGTCLRLDTSGARGLGMMVEISCPLDF